MALSSLYLPRIALINVPAIYRRGREVTAATGALTFDGGSIRIGHPVRPDTGLEPSQLRRPQPDRFVTEHCAQVMQVGMLPEFPPLGGEPDIHLAVMVQ